MTAHILLLEDSITVSMSLSGALSSAGFQTTVCDTCAAAREALQREPRFALVILDVLLPDGDGRSILREIRKNPEMEGIPVLILSSAAEIGNRMYGLNVGAAAYIGKPCGGAYLVRRVREALGMSGDTLTDSVGAMQSGHKILAVDDSPVFLVSLAEKLRREGNEVVLALSGAEALNLLAVDQVDCVLLDLLMPGLDGIETCRRIRAMPQQQGLPIMILTGTDMPEARNKASEAGADDFVLKSQSVGVYLRELLQRKRGATALPEGGQEAAEPPPAGSPAVLARPNSNLLERVAAISGLSPLIARVTIEGACQRVGLDAATLTPSELLQALPAIDEALKPHLSDGQRSQRVDVMAALARLVERSTRGGSDRAPKKGGKD